MVNPFSSFSISNSKGEEKRNASVFIVSSCSWICFDTRLARFIGCKKTRLKTGSVNGWKCRPLIFCWNWWRPHGLMRVAKKMHRRSELSFHACNDYQKLSEISLSDTRRDCLQFRPMLDNDDDGEQRGACYTVLLGWWAATNYVWLKLIVNHFLLSVHHRLVKIHVHNLLHSGKL